MKPPGPVAAQASSRAQMGNSHHAIRLLENRATSDSATGYGAA